MAETVEVIYKVNYDQYKKEMASATVEVKKFDDVQAKSQKETQAGIQKSTEGVKSFKSQIKEATQAYLELAAKHGETSREATKAAQAVGKLKGEFADFQERVKTFDPNKKFQSLKDSVNVAASAFQGLIAAQALLGNNSEELQKTLLKVQAAMALSDSISSLLDAGDAFKNLKGVITQTVIPSLFSLKGALVATGLGALAVVLGSIIANWDKVVAGFQKAFPTLNKVGEVWDTAKKRMYGFLNATFEGLGILKDVIVDVFTAPWRLKDDLKDIGGRLAKAYAEGYREEEQAQAEEGQRLIVENAIKANKLKLNVMKAGGKNTYALQRQILLDELSLIDQNNKSEIDKYKEKLNEIEVLDTAHRKTLADNKEKEKKEKDKKATEEFEKEFADLQDAEKIRVEKELETTKELDRQKKESLEHDIENAQVRADDAIAKEKTIAAAKVETFQTVGNAIQSLSALTSESAEIEKTLAISQAIINTYLGASKALATLPPPFSFISAAATVTAGLINVEKIATTEIPKKTVTPKFKDGVVNLDGPGTETSDSIYARLSRGESVITARATSAKEDELKALNNSIMDYEQLIYAKYVKPALDKEKKKTFAESVAASLALNSNFDDSRIVEAINKQKPATKGDIERLVKTVEKTARESTFLKRNSISR